MAVTLTVSEVRQALQQAGGQPGDGAPSTAAIGTLFHRVLSELLRPDSPCNVESAVRDLDPDLDLWQTTLKRHAYDQLVGPLLTQQVASMQSHGDKILSLWIAVQAACDMLARMWWEITKHGTAPVDQKNWFFAEQPVILELDRPGWKEPVAIIGQTDAVLQVPKKDCWCVLEWKLGKCSPEVDLGQACLYHMILQKTANFSGNSALAIVSFRPNRVELLFEHNQLVEAQDRLVDLIGKLAGVVEANPLSPDRSADQNKSTLIPATNVEHVSNVLGGTETGTLKTCPTSAQPSTSSTPPQQIPPDFGLQTNSVRKVEPASTRPPASPSEWISPLQEKLLKVLKQSGAPCREAKPSVVGPTFARFFVLPQTGIRAQKVIAQADQVHLHLALEAPPAMYVNNGTIAIDLPRPERVMISFSELIPELPALNPLLGSSKIPVGVDLNARWEWCDLADSESAHMLVVGTPGSGKSQWLRVALASLMRTNTPETLQVLLIDPKQNAFQFAKNSPFLRQPIIVPGDLDDEDGISGFLVDLIAEMTTRNRKFAAANCQDLSQYIRQTNQPMPRIICICDEYADLLLQCGKPERNAIEHALKRLAAMGRSAGIHLILATQQPRANVVTTAIRSVIGAKVALRVTSPLESKIALNDHGAERLLGNGDLLYQCIGAAMRLQGAWLPAEEESAAHTASDHCAVMMATRIRD